MRLYCGNIHNNDQMRITSKNYTTIYNTKDNKSMYITIIQDLKYWYVSSKNSGNCKQTWKVCLKMANKNRQVSIVAKLAR